MAITTAGSCCGPEIAAGRPAAGRNDVHCAVVAVTVDVFGRAPAGRSKCGPERLHQTDRRTNCRVLLWAGKAAGRPAAGRHDVHCAVVAVTVDVFGRAGRSKCGQRLHDRRTDGLIECLQSTPLYAKAISGINH